MTNDDDLTPEQRALFADMSPDEAARIHGHAQMVAVVFEFMGSMRDDANLESVWHSVDPSMQRTMAKHRLNANRSQLTIDGYDFDDVLAEFTTDEPDHDLWHHFERVQTRTLTQAMPEDYGIGSATRLVAPDIELLYIHDRSQPEGGV